MERDAGLSCRCVFCVVVAVRCRAAVARHVAHGGYRERFSGRCENHGSRCGNRGGCCEKRGGFRVAHIACFAVRR